jgi:hypothetical protein
MQKREVSISFTRERAPWTAISASVGVEITSVFARVPISRNWNKKVVGRCVNTNVWWSLM